MRVVHVEALAEQGLLNVSRIYKQRPLYRVAEVEALATDPLGRALLSDMVSGARSTG